MKLAVIRENRTIDNRDWTVEKIIDGTWKDVDYWEDHENNTFYHVLPYKEGYVWDKADYTAGYVENGKVVKWYDGYDAQNIFETLWGNIFG